MTGRYSKPDTTPENTSLTNNRFLKRACNRAERDAVSQSSQSDVPTKGNTNSGTVQHPRTVHSENSANHAGEALRLASRAQIIKATVSTQRIVYPRAFVENSTRTEEVATRAAAKYAAVLPENLRTRTNVNSGRIVPAKRAGSRTDHSEMPKTLMLKCTSSV